MGHRGFLLGLLGLMACGDVQEMRVPVVRIAQPFPAFAADLLRFPAQYQGTYQPLGDSTRQLCIDEQTIWQQQIHRAALARPVADSLGLVLENPGRWRASSAFRYRLRQHSADSLWLDVAWPDTLFNLRHSGNRLRRWRGHYYLSIADSLGWHPERLQLTSEQLRWEALGTDTLRLRVLPPGVVRRAGGRWMLQFFTRPQARQLARYAGLWEEKGTYQRR